MITTALILAFKVYQLAVITSVARRVCYDHMILYEKTTRPCTTILIYSTAFNSCTHSVLTLLISHLYFLLLNFPFKWQVN